MRGLSEVATLAAVVLSAPSLALGPAQVPPHDDFTDAKTCDAPSTALVTLNVQVQPEVYRPVTLRLDILASTTLSCDPGNVKLYGHELPTQPGGRGEGVLDLDNDISPLTAKWAFTCFGDDDDETAYGAPFPSLLLDMSITGVEGRPVPEVGFAAVLKLVSPVDISVVSDDIVGPVQFCSDRRQRTLYKPEKQRQHQQHKEKQTVSGSTTAKPHEAEKTCGFSWSRLVNCAANGAHRLYEDVMSKVYATTDKHVNSQSSQEGQDGGQEQFHIVSRPQSGTKMKPITPAEYAPVFSTPVSTPYLLPSLPPANNDLLVTLTIAGTLFLVFSLLGVTILSSHTRPFSHQRHPRHRETLEERLARVSERRSAIRGLFSRLFSGIFTFSEKTDDESSSPQGRDLRNTSEDTTVEQELAGLIQVADMVSNMVAAEEGRSTAHRQDQSQQSWSEPVRGRDAARSTNTANHATESPPPSYESDSVDASLVADGFRYAPGQLIDRQDGIIPQEDRSHQSNSDRLGYGNKD